MSYCIELDHEHHLIRQTASDIFTEHQSWEAIGRIRAMAEFPDYGLVLDFRPARRIALSCDHLEHLARRIGTEIPVCARALLVNEKDRETAELFARAACRGFESVRLFDDLEDAVFWAGRVPVAA